MGRSRRLTRGLAPLFVVAVGACSSSFVSSLATSNAEPTPVHAPEKAPRAIPIDETVVDANDLPRTLAPAAHNPLADIHRAGILAEGAEESGEIALTFDDGPGADTTPEVLRILAAHKVKGAFFLTGKRLAGSGVVPEVHRGIARSILAAGHTIGNHGLDHVAVNKLDPAWNAHQIESSAQLIVEATGVPTHYFRPPYGKIGAAAQQLLAERRDELVMWTIDGQDTVENNAERLAVRMEGQLQFAGQGIVLMHDLRPTSVRALALFLDWIEAHPRDDVAKTGYRVVDLPTFMAHASARPYPYRTRLELYHAREKLHALAKAAAKS